MQTYLLAAGIVALLTGAVHSVLGEILIFHPLREGGLIPTRGGALLRERNVRILWASWHVVTVLGWGFAAILLRLATTADQSPLQPFVERVIVVSMLTSSFFVLVGTKGMHPGWIALLVVAVLTWLA